MCTQVGTIYMANWAGGPSLEPKSDPGVVFEQPDQCPGGFCQGPWLCLSDNIKSWGTTLMEGVRDRSRPTP